MFKNQEHKKQIQEENQNNIRQNNIDCLKEIQRRQIKSIEKLNTVLEIRKKTRRL